jgi:pyruvate kinase
MTEPLTLESVATAREAAARQLHATLAPLADDIRGRADRIAAAFAPLVERPAFRAPARNLADYLALRRTDLSPVQQPLAALGLSSLGRCEAHVQASLDAVLASLALLAGRDGPPHPPAAVFAEGRARLEAGRDALFGAAAPGAPATRIMVTLPSDAADGPQLIAALVAAGADCLRINTAHDGPDAWARMATHARAAAAAAGRRVPIVMDLAGPKLRVAAVSAPDRIRLHPGDRFALAAGLDAAPGLFTATLSHPALLAGLEPGMPVWIDDGKLRARVLARHPAHAELEVTSARAKGARIKPEKGVNLPGRDLDIPALTEADRASLDAVLAIADVVSYSFVQTREDVRALLAALGERAAGRPLPAIMLKIETPRAVLELPWLIVEAGGRVPVAVMIARGDLAVEIGFERLSEIQEEILWLCEAAQVPAIWATQVLEGLVKEGQASRAETTDAAMAQRAECVMLNKGPHAVEAVTFLRGILRRMDRHQHKKTPRLGILNAWDLP